MFIILLKKDYNEGMKCAAMVSTDRNFFPYLLLQDLGELKVMVIPFHFVAPLN